MTKRRNNQFKETKMLIKHILLLCISFIFVGISEAADMSSKVENLGSLRSLEVPEIKVRSKNGLMQVQVKFLNTSIYDQEVYYRFKWLDADGFNATEPDAWKTMRLIGKQNMLITTSAPTPVAKDFRLEIQAPPNKSILNPF